MSRNHWANQINSGDMKKIIASMSERISELKRQRDEDDRKVFVFEGTVQQFREAAGVMGSPEKTAAQYAAMANLMVIEVGGRTLIGTPTAIRNLTNPKYGFEIDGLKLKLRVEP